MHPTWAAPEGANYQKSVLGQKKLQAKIWPQKNIAAKSWHQHASHEQLGIALARGLRAFPCKGSS
jgi:hypothetical protein